MHAKRRDLAFAGVLLGMLPAQLDLTVVVTAVPRIEAELRAGPAIAGVTAVYLLTTTVATPILGRLGDLYGRRLLFVIVTITFAAGSLWCALATSIGELVAARALQGLGGSGLIVGALAALGELFTRDELIRRQGWQVALGAIASLAGPPLGGLVSATFGWRWLFLANLPLITLALILGLIGLPGRHPDTPPSTFDLAGAALLALAGTAATLLGTIPALASSPLWTPLLIGIALLAAIVFVRRQRRVPHPLIPPALLADRLTARAVVATAFAGVALYGTFTFVSLVLTLVADTRATGLLLLAMTGGSLAVSSCFAVLARRHPNMTAWGRAGCVAGAIGLALIAVSIHSGGVLLPAIGLILIGASFMLVVSAYTVLAQGRATPETMGAAMGLFVFARQAGGVLGATVLGWLALLLTGAFAAPGLTVVFAAAALAMVAAVLLSPRAVTTGEVISSTR